MSYGAVDRKTWNDERFRAWDHTTRAVWLYLLTCPHGNRLGCFVLPAYYIADDVMISPEEAESALARLQEDGRIVWDRTLRVVCVLRHLHPDYNPLANPNVVKAAVHDLDTLPDSRPCLEALADAVERFGQPLTQRGQPFYSLLSVQLSARLADLDGNGYRNGFRNGMPNPDPDPDPYPDPRTATEPPSVSPHRRNPATSRHATGSDTGQPPTAPRADDEPVAGAEEQPQPMDPRPNDLRPGQHTEYEIRDAALATLGLGQLGVRERRSNEELVRRWLYSGDEQRGREAIWAAIHGAARIRDDGSQWLEVGKPYGLRVLVRAGALRDQGDGKSEASLWDLAVDRFYAEPRSAAGIGHPRNGPTRVQVEVSAP
jgi:hypothetical protein